MIRKIVFKFFFYTGVIAVFIIFLPALILPQKIMLLGGRMLGHWIKFCLIIFLSVKIEIKGKKNEVIEAKNAIIATGSKPASLPYIKKCL